MDTGGGAERSVEVGTVSARDRIALLAAFGAVYFIWGSTYLGIAWAIESIPPLLMIGGRCVLAGGVLYGWARVRGGARPSGADWRAAAIAGVLLFVTGQAVLAWSETRIPSGAASLLIATEPLFVALLGWGGARLTGTAGSRPKALTFGAILLGFAGVAVLVMPGGGGGLDLLGAAAAVGASLSWSIGVFRAGSRPGIGAGQMAGMQLLVAGAVLMVVSTGLGDVARIPAGGPTLRSLAAFFYLVVFGSVVAFGAYVWLLGQVGPGRLSTHAYVNPLVAVALGAALNGEPLTTGLIVATALILGSVAMLLRGSRVARAERGSAPGLDHGRAGRVGRATVGDRAPAGAASTSGVGRISARGSRREPVQTGPARPFPGRLSSSRR